jgi:hypothetical protein
MSRAPVKNATFPSKRRKRAGRVLAGERDRARRAPPRVRARTLVDEPEVDVRSGARLHGHGDAVLEAVRSRLLLRRISAADGALRVVHEVHCPALGAAAALGEGGRPVHALAVEVPLSLVGRLEHFRTVEGRAVGRGLEPGAAEDAPIDRNAQNDGRPLGGVGRGARLAPCEHVGVGGRQSHVSCEDAVLDARVEEADYSLTVAEGHPEAPRPSCRALVERIDPARVHGREPERPLAGHGGVEAELVKHPGEHVVGRRSAVLGIFLHGLPVGDGPWAAGGRRGSFKTAAGRRLGWLAWCGWDGGWNCARFSAGALPRANGGESQRCGASLSVMVSHGPPRELGRGREAAPIGQKK